MARAELRNSLVELRSPPDRPYEPGGLRLRRVGADRHVALQRAAHLARAAVRAAGRVVRLLRMAGHDRARRLVAACGLEHVEGVRGARVAVRHRDRGRVDRVRHRVLRHDRTAQGRADLHFELVLRRADHRDRDAARREQPRAARDDVEVLFSVRGRAGRDRGMVVRPQRGRIPADRRLHRDALLLPAETGGAADLELQALDRRILGVRLQLHLGRPAPSALQRDPRVGAVARRRHESRAARAVVGDDDQRRDDGREGVAQDCESTLRSSSSCSRSRSTDSRRSKVQCSRSAA